MIASLAFLSRLFDWRSALVVVRPETLIRWHRAGFRLFWRYKSRPGRPRTSRELGRLIRRMAAENPLWGEKRIANKLLVELGIRVSPRTLRKYMPKQPRGRPRGDQRWATFFAQPRKGDHGMGFLHCGRGHLPVALRVGVDRARLAPVVSLYRNRTAHRRLEARTASGRRRIRQRISILAARSRQHLCREA